MHLQAKLFIHMSKLFPPAPSYLLQYKTKHEPNPPTAQTEKKRKQFSDEPVKISLMSTWKAQVLQGLMLRRFDYNRTGRGCSEESVQTEEIMPCYEGIKKLILANFSCSIQQKYFSMLQSLEIGLV